MVVSRVMYQGWVDRDGRYFSALHIIHNIIQLYEYVYESLWGTLSHLEKEDSTAGKGFGTPRSDLYLLIDFRQ